MRGSDSEFVLACDMRFAARESAVFGQPETGFGLIPGGGGIQHLSRLMGRGMALEVMLSAQDSDAEPAEHYGWINRAIPAKALDDFVDALAHRIALLPAGALAAMKRGYQTRDDCLWLAGTRPGMLTPERHREQRRGPR